MKKQGLGGKDLRVEQAFQQTQTRALFVQTIIRDLHERVAASKKDSELERREMDAQNLALQSLLYEKDHFLKEIHFCRELKTPQLKQALLTEVYERFKNLELSTSDEQHRLNL